MNPLKALLTPKELKDRSVYGSHRKLPLNLNHIDYIKQLLVTVNGGEHITDKSNLTRKF